MEVEQTRKDNTIYTPGQLICRKTDDYVLGDGVYLENGGIYAGIVGKSSLVKTDDDKTLVHVESIIPKIFGSSVVIGDEVLARVSKLKEETVFVEILAINGLPTTH